MKFYTHNEGQLPRLNDEVTFEMAQVFNDSLLFTTAGNEPMQLVLKKGDFVGDVPDALLMMHVGDSARLVVSVDSVLTSMLGMEEVPRIGLSYSSIRITTCLPVFSYAALIRFLSLGAARKSETSTSYFFS